MSEYSRLQFATENVSFLDLQLILLLVRTSPQCRNLARFPFKLANKSGLSSNVSSKENPRNLLAASQTLLFLSGLLGLSTG